MGTPVDKIADWSDLDDNELALLRNKSNEVVVLQAAKDFRMDSADLPSEFVESVRHIGSYVRKANRALGDAIIEADNLKNAGNLEGALDVLAHFIDTYPSDSYVELAQIQHYNLKHNI